MKLFFGVPFFNDSNYLSEALKSILTQTHADWMAVVFDDSIEESESKLAQAVVEKINDPRIRYSKNPQNIGLSQNMNQGLSSGIQSGCEGVTILHGDDNLDPAYAEQMLKAIKENPQVEAVFCKSKIIDQIGHDRFSFPDWYKDRLLPEMTDGNFYLKGLKGIEALIPGNFIFCPTLCFNSKKIGSHRFQEDLKMVPDFALTLNILLQGGSLLGLYSAPLYYYRRHQKNATNLYNKSLLRFKEERDLYLRLAHQLEERGNPSLALECRKLKIVKLNLLFNAAKSFIHFDFKSTWNFLRFLAFET